ncbi:MAG: hypothetical protein R6V28_04920 [Nitriliruptoraceae bacterium]
MDDPTRAGVWRDLSSKPRLIHVDTRGPGEYGRSSPRMRFDPLQLVAWLLGLWTIVTGVIALARAGFDDLAVFTPVVEVAGAPLTPLLATLLLLLGIVLLTLATGEVDDRTLRILGVVCAISGVVWLIEPDAFEPYLATQTEHGTRALLVGGGLVAASFLPPLSIRRPGVRR